MTNNGPRILKEGDADCVHHESIDADMIGTCGKCGRIRSHRRGAGLGINSSHLIPIPEMTLMQVKARNGKKPVRTSGPTRRQIHVPQPVKVKRRPVRKGVSND